MGSESWPVRSPLLWKHCSKHHQLNEKTCRTPARKGYGSHVSKRRVGMNYRKTVHRLALLTEAKAGLDCSDGPTLVRKGSVPLREGGGCRAHQNTRRSRSYPARFRAPG